MMKCVFAWPLFLLSFVVFYGGIMMVFFGILFALVWVLCLPVAWITTFFTASGDPAWCVWSYTVVPTVVDHWSLIWRGLLGYGCVGLALLPISWWFERVARTQGKQTFGLFNDLDLWRALVLVPIFHLFGWPLVMMESTGAILGIDLTSEEPRKEKSWDPWAWYHDD